MFNLDCKHLAGICGSNPPTRLCLKKNLITTCEGCDEFERLACEQCEISKLCKKFTNSDLQSPTAYPAMQ